MGLVSWCIFFIPVVLVLVFLAGRRFHAWLLIRQRPLIVAWILALLLVTSMLFLPTYQWIDTVVSPFRKPFDAFYSGLMYLIPLLALILATLLLFNGLARIKQQPASGAKNGAGVKPASQPTAWIAVSSLVLSGLLFGSAFYILYYQFIWDSATDSLGILLLFGPLFAVLVSGLFLSGSLRGRNMVYGLLYTLFLAAVVVSVYTAAKKVDYRQLTEKRAAAVTRALDAYYARQGRYPPSLRQLAPWTLLVLPKPVIMHGQDWCYQSGAGYYRLGYVSRDHWSSPYLSVRVYQTAGAAPDHPALCEAETDAIIARESIFSLIK